MKSFVPKLVTTLKGYTRADLRADLAAGLIVGIVALPLSVAFAVASGVTPDRGLWTGIVAGFLISALGGSRVQIGGPTGAFVVIVYGIVQAYGVDGLIVATLMAGAILIAMGLLRFGAAIKFIPHPVIIGFTSGIALIIFSTQVKDFVGLRAGPVPAEFVAAWQTYARHLDSVDPVAVGVSLLALAIVLAWPRVTRKVPSPFVALIVTTAVVHFGHLDVETIGSRFGAISAAIPHPKLPSLTWSQVAGLVGPAFTIAMLGGIESLLSAVVADGMIGSRHRSNVELVGQGVANIASALVGGIPATGALARTATNVKSGGRTPIAGMTHALTLLLITLFFGRWAALIPMATLAAILVVVAYNMSEWRAFVHEFRGPRSDVVVLVTTFVLTVLVNLTTAIGVGMVLASFLFMRRMAEVSEVTEIRSEMADEGDENGHEDPRIAGLDRAVQVYAINGPFFFGAADRFRETLAQLGARPKVLVLRLRDVPVIDSTGLSTLQDVVVRSRAAGTRVLLAEVRPRVRRVIERSRLGDVLDSSAITETLEAALSQVRGGQAPRGADGTPAGPSPDHAGGRRSTDRNVQD